MPAWNTPERYGAVAIALHWLIAALFLVSYAAVYLTGLFIERTQSGPPPGLSVHKAVGISILVFAVLRLGWRLINVQPHELEAPAWQHWAARLVHFALYLFMFLMPLSGYLGSRGPTNFGLFSLPAFRDTGLFQTLVVGELGMTRQSFEAPIHAFHHIVGENILWILILLHAAAAIYHHLVVRDRVLARMAYGM